MRHITAIIIASLLALPTFASQEGNDSKSVKEQQKFSFQKPESKKEIKKERDSLLRLSNQLRFELDSLYKIYGEALAVIEMESSDDTLGSGLFENNYDEYLITDSISRDSLISLWYHRRDLDIVGMEPSDIDTIEMTSDIPDSVYLCKLQKLNSYISVPYNKAIRNHIIYYTQKMPDKMETILGLASYYIPVFEEIFDQYGLPVELTAMAVIESALDAKAVSRARAKGMWQFMYTTAKRYGLTINSYVDERFDPVAAAHAAAKYLRDSYSIFQDWPLAIASYNCGVGNVNKAIRRAGGSKDFWEVYSYLPRETRGYVPSFFAALYAMKYYKDYNLTPKNIALPPHTDTLKINKMLHFEQISHFTGISIDELRTHNPQYLHDIIPGVEREYTLYLPYKYTNAFIDNEEAIYKYKDSVYFNPSALKKIQQAGNSGSGDRIVHKVRRGETLSHISLKYGVSIRNIQRWNNIGTKIREGQKLVIYPKGYSGNTNSKSSTASYSTKTNPATTVSNGYVIYTVKNGDNLWDIARKFNGVSMNDIMRLNGLDKNSKIHPGKKLKIKKAN